MENKKIEIDLTEQIRNNVEGTIKIYDDYNNLVHQQPMNSLLQNFVGAVGKMLCADGTSILTSYIKNNTGSAIANTSIPTLDTTNNNTSNITLGTGSFD